MVELSDEQREALRRLLSSRAQVQTLGGYAGTGKTTLIGQLIRKLSGWHVCAYTGKAANVLRRKGVGGASTIHSAIYRPIEEPDGTVSWELRDREDVDCRGFVVDEASMVGESLHRDLLSFDRPIVYVGDHGQLEPVGERGFNLMESPDVTLETVHRNAGEIARFAEHLRKGGEADGWPGDERPQVRVMARDDWEDTQDDVPDQMICAFNATRTGLNAAAREHLGLPEGVPAVGDRVMCLQNSRELGLFNGMQGEIARIDLDRAVLTFRADGFRVEAAYVPEQFGAERKIEEWQTGRLPFDWCYCVTCHKAQGDEWDRVTVFEQRCKHWDHRRWAYTAASRARRELTWIKER